MRRLPTFVSILAVAFIGCGDPTALGVAARTAQAVACTVCGTAQPDVREQAAVLSRSIAQLTEAIAVLAAQKDSAETSARLAALRERAAQDRADFDRLVELAAKALPPPAVTVSPAVSSSAPPAASATSVPGAP